MQQPARGATHQDPDDERRQSGQAASTSQSPGKRQGQPEAPSFKGSSSGAFPSGPFASIGIRDGRRSKRSPNKARTAQQGPSSPAQSVPDSKPATQYTSTNMHGHDKDVLVNSNSKHGKRHSSNDTSPAKQGSPSSLPEAPAAHAVTDTAALPVLSHQSSQRTQPHATDLNSRHTCSTSPTHTAEPSLVTDVGGCNAEHDKPVSVLPNAAALMADGQLPGGDETTSNALETDLYDSPAVRQRRRKKGGARQPGPPAFPQLPYQRTLQLLESSHTESASSSLAEPGSASPATALDTAQHKPAQTDNMAAGMQSRLQQLQMQELRAEGQGEGQERGPQQQMSQHGGYMQREGCERLPRRRTTRSMLRGADTQTGDALLHAASPFGPCCDATKKLCQNLREAVCKSKAADPIPCSLRK